MPKTTQVREILRIRGITIRRRVQLPIGRLQVRIRLKKIKRSMMRENLHLQWKEIPNVELALEVPEIPSIIIKEMAQVRKETSNLFLAPKFS